MLYSIGTSKNTHARLRAVMRVLKVALLIDVRSKPVSRVAVWRKPALSAAFGSEYRWAGDTLGGFGDGVRPEGLAWLRTVENGILLCQEEAPGDCHRHHKIAMALLPDIEVVHVFRDELIRASELNRAIQHNEDYACDDLPKLGEEIR